MRKTRDTEVIYREMRQFLSENGIDAPIDARVIFEKVFGYPYYHVGERPPATDGELEKLEQLLRKRASGYPLQYIAESWPFLDFELIVGEGVLIPRPDTEDVAVYCIEAIKEIERPVVLDLCAGTGCIAAAVKRSRPDAEVTAVEYLADALLYLRRNIEALGLDIVAVEGDVFRYQNELEDESIDLIVSNPPYVSVDEYRALEPELYYEPKRALCDSLDGYRFYRHIAATYYSKLKDGGRLVFEIGDNQGDMIKEIALGAGYRDIKIANDFFRNPRILSARK